MLQEPVWVARAPGRLDVMGGIAGDGDIAACRSLATCLSTPNTAWEQMSAGECWSLSGVRHIMCLCGPDNTASPCQGRPQAGWIIHSLTRMSKTHLPPHISAINIGAALVSSSNLLPLPQPKPIMTKDAQMLFVLQTIAGPWSCSCP